MIDTETTAVGFCSRGEKLGSAVTITMKSGAKEGAGVGKIGG